MANGQFDGTSCVSTIACTAVGSYTDPSGTSRALVETWNGMMWTITPAAPGGAALEATLRGVSCATPASCVAVGSSYTADGEQALAEHWDGTAGTSTRPASPDV